MRDIKFEAIDRAVADIAAGRAVVVMDDESRENEGDLVFAASLATEALVAFTVRHSSGVVCVPMTGERLDELQVPLMTERNAESMRTAFTVTVDAATGVTTGISAADRARTINVLAAPGSSPADLVRPGHLFPLRAHDAGVLGRPGHTEAAVDLLRLAGLPPVGVICELVEDDGSMRRGASLRRFADAHGLALVSIADLIAHLRGAGGVEPDAGPAVVALPGPRPERGPERLVARVATTRLPTRWGTFDAVGYRAADGSEHVALVMGDPRGAEELLVRLHSECLTGDVFGSRRCDCGQQLQAALERVATAGRGVVVYLGGHEGRGIGLLQKLRAYALQDQGLDTVEANLALGWPVDGRDFTVGAAIVADLGVVSVRLITNNPAKERAFADSGIVVVERVAVPVEVTDENRRYLTTKRERMGHALDVSAASRRPA